MEQVVESAVMKAKTWLKPPRVCRKRLDDEKLLHLGNNIASLGMFNPIEALPDGEIISGYHRWLAVMARDDIRDVPVRVISDPLDAKGIRIRRLSENLQRKDLLFYDKYIECRGFMDDEPKISSKQIARAINVEASTVTRYLCLDRCIDAVRQAAMENRLGMKEAYEISKLDKDRQAKKLADALARRARRGNKPPKPAAGTVPAAKPGRLKFSVPSGFVVTLSGGDKAVTVDIAIKELSSALAELKEVKSSKKSLKEFMEGFKKPVTCGGVPPADPLSFEVPNV